MAQILVTGASGYIGYPLMRKLWNNDYDAMGVDNNARDIWVSRITGYRTWQDAKRTIEGDLTDKDFVNEILRIHRPEVIIHLASQPSMPYSSDHRSRNAHPPPARISQQWRSTGQPIWLDWFHLF